MSELGVKSSRAGQSDPEDWHVSKDGQRFNLYSNRWQLSAHRSLKVDKLRNLCWSPVIADAALRTLAYSAEKGAAGSLFGKEYYVRQFLHFASAHIRTDEITLAVVVSYRDACSGQGGDEHVFASVIRPFLCTWYALGYPGISRSLVETMKGWVLKGREVGVAVNRLDADSGPLMPDEHTAVAAHLLTAFERGAISLDDYVMTRLSSVTGRRPSQIMQLKCKDMDDTRHEDLEPGRPPRRILLLHIPRIKGKGQQWRTRFRAVPLSSDLWNLLVMQRNAVHTRMEAFMELCGVSLQPSDLTAIRSEMPLIPAWWIIDRAAMGLRSAFQASHSGGLGQLYALASSDAWHAGALRVAMALAKVKCCVKNREGGALHVFPRRLRYTRAFDLERAGCAPPVIAWNMDHSSTESLASYSRNGPDRARTLGDAMDLKLAPFAMIFQGRVVTSEAEAEGGDDPARSRILFHDLKPGASCATKRGCGMTAIPRPCYNGCQHFRPWIDGPHEEFLESLLEERERALRLLCPVGDREVIEAGDSLIIGVVQVIRLCEERRVELSLQSKTVAPGRRTRSAK